jgi:PleD family two-component response regulator
MDSNKIVRRIHSNHRTAHTPFIILTDKSEPPDIKEGLESAVVDYINKPFDVQQLRLHVRNALRRTTQDSLTNPVTGLPEGLLVDEHLNDCLEASTWTLLIASLENLDSFREVYGFVACDDVLRAVSMMIQNAVNELGDENDFLGHLSPTEFILVSARATITQLQERIRNRVTQSLGYFYPIKDREKAAGLGKRITFKVGILQSEEGFFSSLDAVKTSLQLKKHEDYPCK